MNSAICTSTRSFPLKPLAAAVLLMYATGIQSAPVQQGRNPNIDIDQSVENITTVTQTNNRDLINWREFSIGTNETVEFIQPNANAVILNRVTGANPSEIFGVLRANGRVFLINPNGIVFGANSQVSVNGLVASTLNLKPGFQGNSNNSEFELELDGDAASIVNNGQITANDILLIAPLMTNHGILNGTTTANGLSGKVQLIAASEVTVNTAGDNLAFEVQAGHEDALIDQLGTVMAQGGRVLLLATPSAGSTSSVINVAGVNRAARISVEGNTVSLRGDINSDNGTGVLDVNATNIGQTEAVNVGGQARLNANTVALGDVNNDFTGTVVLNVTGQTELRDANELVAQGNVGSATLTADSMLLGDFSATGALSVNANNGVTLSQLSADQLNVSAGSVTQHANQALEVSGITGLMANEVNLGNSGNNFAGQLDLNVAEQATLNSVGVLAVRGEVGSAMLSGGSVLLGDLTVADNLTATAQGSVGQVENSALNVGGVTDLNAADVTLSNESNSFARSVNLNVTDETTLHGTGRLDVAGSLNHATLEAQNLVLTDLAVGGDLILKADTINQTSVLLVPGTTRIENTGNVNLALSNDFVGDVTLAGSSSTNAIVNLTDRNQIIVGGQAGTVNVIASEPGTGVVTLSNLRAQALTVNANTVRNADTSTFSGSVNVSGATELTANNVELGNINNNFGGQVTLQVSGQATLSDSNNLSVRGTVGDNLTLAASSITQENALNVGGNTRINNAASAVLANTGNDFVGTVELRDAGDVELADRNSVLVFGNAGTLEVSTNSGNTILGESTTGELTTGTLVVNAQGIDQNARVVVNGESTLNASEIELSRFENDFGGKVTLNVDGQAELRDANNLRVAGTSNVTDLTAQTLVVDGLTTQGTSTLTAGVIRQDGALIANGAMNLKGGDVNLNTSPANVFEGAVDLDLTGDANIRSSDQLVVTGTAAIVNAAATNSLTVATLNSENIALSANQVHLQNFTAPGDLTLNGSTINQQGALVVEGTTTLGASNVLLGQQPNDFKGNVVLSNAGNVALQDANNVRVQGTAGTLTLTAAGEVGQSGVLNIVETSSVTASRISLDNDANRFGGEVALQATETATVHASNTLQVRGNAKTLNVNSTGDVVLGATTAGTLAATATEEIRQGQSTAVVVDNAASLTAESLVLNNNANDFKNAVNLNVAGQASINDLNNLVIQGNAQTLNATAGGVLTAGALEGVNIENGTLTAETIELNRLNVSSAARLQADTITQTEASNTGGRLTLNAPVVTLTQETNDFRGELILEGVQTATLHDANQLSIGGDVGTLTAQAQQINQSPEAGNEVRVTGETNLNAQSVDLRNGNNDFAGEVNLQVSGQAQLRDANTLTLQGNAGQLNASAQHIDQLADSTLTVVNNTTLNAGSVNLNESGNDFQGHVQLNVSGNATVRDANTLTLQGNAGQLDASALQIEQLLNSTLTVANTATLAANTVNLNESGNDFQGNVQLNVSGNATVRDANNIEVQGMADTLNLSAAGEAGQSGVLNIAETSSVTASRISLDNNANRFGGEVAVQATETATVHAANNLQVRASAGTLNVNSGGDVELGATAVGALVANAGGQIKQTQSTAVVVDNAASLSAESVELNNSDNDFKDVLNLNVAGQATINGQNNLHIQGNAQTLAATARGTLTAGNTETLNIDAGALTAATIEVNKLNVLDAARLQADTITQTEASNTGGTLTLNAPVITLSQETNDFQGELILEGVQTATIKDANQLSVGGTAGALNASAVESLSFTDLAAGTLTAQAGQINQTSGAGNAVRVSGRVNLNAEGVDLRNSTNDFMGEVNLQVSGQAQLRDANSIRVQGTAGTLNLSAAGEVEQSAVLNVGGASNIAAANINLNNEANRFGGEVAVQATETATVHAANNLQVRGDANTLNVNSTGDVVLGATTVGTLSATATDEIRQTQSTAVVVNNAASLTAESLVLNNNSNDFKNVLSLNVSGQATVSDQNNLQIQGRAQDLTATATNSVLKLGGLGDLDIGSGTLTASTIEMNKLKVQDAARLQADTITQTEASNTGGRLTLNAPVVTLTQETNDFRGELILEGVQTATLHDANQLSIGGAASTLNASAGETLNFTDLAAGNLNAQAQQINQNSGAGNEVRVTGNTNLNAQSVDLRNSNNDFVGAVNLQVGGQAQLRDANTLTLQGNAGQLDVTAQQVNQRADTSLTVASTTAVDANNVVLGEADNDFQGDVQLNVSGNATVRDANTLNVEGRVNGATTLLAQSIEQTNALRTDSTLLLQANNVNLSSAENQFNGPVRIENAAQATLVSQGDLAVAGSNLENVNFTAEEVTLNELGSLQQLTVAADEVKQNAALLVQGQSRFSANQVELNNSNNDFVGAVVVQARSASNPTVQIRDRNALTVQGNNLALSAEVQGNLRVQANNLALGRSTVAGSTQIDLTGALTQTQSITLNGSQIKADRITLNHSANRFNGITQLDSEQQIELRTAGDITADTGSSTGALALNIGGNTTMQGEQITLAQSQFGGNLTVDANQISQSTGAIEVEGNTQLAAVGGAINLHNERNQFSGVISANAEQTSIAANGDLRLLNLTSRGGEINADGRLLLLGNIEQTGGTLTFTARGIPRPLSSAELALMLPPSLDVFSNKEAVNPITGLGRLEVSSAVIDQQSGQISSAAGASTVFHSSQGGSINLTQVNQINGQLSALSGPAYRHVFAYNPNRGSNLFAVNNDVRLRIGESGVEADLVAIRSRGLSTEGADAVIHARMPYNDLAVGTSRSFPGLTLSIPLNNEAGTQIGTAPFGESGNSGQSSGGGAIRVEVGDSSRAGLGGFLTVLPFEGSNLLPGQVVYLAGPERRGTQAFFYDGARSLDRIPVVYNGTLLLSPQENAALTTAQGAVVLARQEQTRSVVRTENVAGKVINGVVVEVGPGRPATEGEGGAGKPASCDSAESDLNCNP